MQNIMNIATIENLLVKVIEDEPNEIQMFYIKLVSGAIADVLELNNNRNYRQNAEKITKQHAMEAQAWLSDQDDYECNPEKTYIGFGYACEILNIQPRVVYKIMEVFKHPERDIFQKVLHSIEEMRNREKRTYTPRRKEV